MFSNGSLSKNQPVSKTPISEMGKSRAMLGEENLKLLLVALCSWQEPPSCSTEHELKTTLTTFIHGTWCCPKHRP